ncbi:Ccr4-Not Transcription Complex Subunit 1 [Manis pentadactyla]|nr:Ccr4-Not Transcription Complex Subunit 1 [Manis pentadactyla]
MGSMASVREDISKPQPLHHFSVSESSLFNLGEELGVQHQMPVIVKSATRLPVIKQRIVQLSENIQEKIAFIFNNLSQSNMTQKVEELEATVKEEFMPWVSQYLVIKRVSIEPDFYRLYSNFLDTLKNPEFSTMVLNETYRNIKVLLTSYKAAANFSDCFLLKNLGHWLGMIKLAKNKPILHTDLDIESLLLQAHIKEQQELLHAVPFVVKVLESGMRSMFFGPPNPWTMTIMNVLANLHQEHDLTLNLKFEIEVLCKNLALDVNELKPGNLLKDKDCLKNLDEQLSAPNKGNGVKPLDNSQIKDIICTHSANRWKCMEEETNGNQLYVSASIKKQMT